VIAFAMSSVTVTVCPLATGRSSTAVTVIATVATFESTPPEVTLNVKLSAPVAFGVGV
jgi:hypothetical protein